ncbi:MAG: CBS domain-containing protein [Alphaproteobacteria bacterium]|nr:CBS domain-containing protein [Alphaproteobacteria bacterium]
MRLGDDPALQRLDAFPYRHRLGDVMSQPLVTIAPERTLADAARLLTERRISALVVLGGDGRPDGIITERDLTRVVAAEGSGGLDAPVRRIMSSPTVTARADDFVYVAIGRLDRLGYRHLVVVAPDGRAIGMVTARSLLRQRAATLALGDEIEVAVDPAGLGRVQRALPALALRLQDEGLTAPEIARVVSAVLRDLTRRATELAVAAMAPTHGPPPAAYAVLVLGSGGRGESLLAADQDNALVHAGGDAADPWFAELGRRLADTLDSAGIPYCKGGVMARERAWRHSLAGWESVIGRWAAAASPNDVLAADIFFDFQAVSGDIGLAEQLRDLALARVRASPMLVRLLAADLASVQAPVGVFGGLRAREGRIDLKVSGLFPIVATTRALALARGLRVTPTLERLRLLVEAAHVPEADAERLREAHALFMTLALEQQVADIGAGIAPGNRVELSRLDAGRRRRLKEAFRNVETFAQAVAGHIV